MSWLKRFTGAENALSMHNPTEGLHYAENQELETALGFTALQEVVSTERTVAATAAAAAGAAREQQIAAQWQLVAARMITNATNGTPM